MNIAIILAGGTGTRLSGDIPKQYIEVSGKTIISYCLEKFEELDVYAMSCWKEYLSNLYGDYLKLSEESKRVSHELRAWRV